MACHLFSAKLLSKPVMTCHQLQHKEQTSAKIVIESNQFPLTKLQLSVIIFIITAIMSRGR